MSPVAVSKRIACIIGIGIAIRFVLAGMLTYTYDVHSWALIISNFESGNGLYDVTGYNYAPPWGYVLGTFSALIEFFGLDVLGIRSTDFLFVEDYKWFFSAFVPSVNFALALEALLTVMDLMVGYVIYRIILERTEDTVKAENGFALWFLCPFVIAVSCVGGMFDAVNALLTCLCIIFVIRRKYLLAGIMLGLATSFKLFPGILMFVLVGYVMNVSRDKQEGIRNVALAGIGAVATVLVLFMPQILDGTLGDCFSFITSRAGSETGSGLSEIERIGTMVFYIALLFVSMILGRRMYRYDGDSKDRMLMTMVFVNLTCLFLYPGTPQYILLILPFILFYMVEFREYRIPYIILCFGTTMFAMAATAANLMSLSEFTGLVSPSWVIDAIQWTQSDLIGGLCLMDILYYTGGVLQYAGILSIIAAMRSRVKGMSQEAPAL